MITDVPHTRESAIEAGPSRPRRRGLWTFVAALTAFVVVVPNGVQMCGRLLRQTQRSRLLSVQHRITALEVDIGDGDLSVSAGGTGGVTVDQTLKWATHKPHVQATWAGTTLRLRGRCDAWAPLSSLSCSVGVHVQVPAGVALQATSTSGTVAADGLAGPVRLSTSSGVVSLRNLAGPVWARADSGVIEGTGLRSGRVDAGLSSGALGLTFAQAPQEVTARASSGSVAVFVPPGQRYQVTTRSSYGSPGVERGLADDTATRRIDARTSSGSIEIRYARP
ncbi:DUF4097 family beta strand repeat-containing protein [Actinoallomurus rhizosphaericola]|uniref:DUF4097 family beta strand repeat-containing protein n=1 Tax=Actinoallomurus rhizosphaericola TaxID=2952536 RepID=UPI00209313FC|nr:DUF4097 family beta strand repeat-containing protein [Actinoallomurus rhizosphaericola]MCO5994831.1 DUF4097 domain-containing protein [Actinoallomurus rhizosphaericola]